VFCLRNNFFVGRLAVFSSEGSIVVDTFFTKALSRHLSPFCSRTGVVGDKNRGWRIREKSSYRDIGKQKRAEGRYYPSQNKPTRNRGNYSGHTLQRRGNIKLDVTIARATRVLVRGFEHAYVAFTSCCFYTAFFSGVAISRPVVTSFSIRSFLSH